MTKRIFAGILAGILLLMLLAPAVSAAETSGTWGNHTWSYDSFTLTISGEGDMEPGQPWAEFKDTIEHVVFTGGVTKIADGAFEDYDAIETIDFGDSMREIGKRAFYDCEDITELRLPDTFRIFGPECFRSCGLLSRIICEGGIMPSFKAGCMQTGSFVSVFYPPNNPWAWEYTNPVMAAYGGQVSFFMASEEIMAEGFKETEPAETEAEETEEVAEEVTEETTAPTEAAVAVAAEEMIPETTAATVPVTEAPTEAPTEPVTVPTTAATEAPTDAPTEAPAEAPTEYVVTEEMLDLFSEETEPVEEEEQRKIPFLSGNSWIGLVMIAGVLTVLLAGAMIFRAGRRNRY